MQQKPRPWPGFLIEQRFCLHCSDEVGKDDGGMFLKHLRGAGGHACIHGSCTERIDAYAFARFRESILSQGHQDAYTNLHSITAEGLKEEAIDGF